MENAPLPRHVDLLIAYANTIDLELVTDDLTTPEELVGWLREHGLPPKPARASEDDLAVARTLREALQAAFTANHDGTGDFTALDDVAARLPLRLGGTDVPGEGPRPGLLPVLDGVPGALSELLVAVNSAVVDGSWRRLKVCSADDCGWSFFDASKNRSRTWCEWGCGNKAKTRSYRARCKASAQTGA
ncbi:CGNR zinc finger domain-containing protein [Angustibacter sp. McL0619]|uniref:CGNR zinc finger domain-containing protein n=1 Tax=Angustibacter sp. McL0619 TaxID=3415676 RepID=UPI003CF9EBBA